MRGEKGCFNCAHQDNAPSDGPCCACGPYFKWWEPKPEDRQPAPIERALATQVSDGSTAGYYELPPDAAELQDLIAYRNMNAQMGEIFRACYRYGQVAHSPKVRDLKKIIFYAQAEIDRLEKYEASR